MLDAAFMIGFDDRFDEDLPGAVALVARQPALAAGLNDRGAISPGLRADLLHVGLWEGHPFVREAWRAGMRVYFDW